MDLHALAVEQRRNFDIACGEFKTPLRAGKGEEPSKVTPEILREIAASCTAKLVTPVFAKKNDEFRFKKVRWAIHQMVSHPNDPGEMGHARGVIEGLGFHFEQGERIRKLAMVMHRTLFPLPKPIEQNHGLENIDSQLDFWKEFFGALNEEYGESINFLVRKKRNEKGQAALSLEESKQVKDAVAAKAVVAYLGISDTNDYRAITEYFEACAREAGNKEIKEILTKRQENGPTARILKRYVPSKHLEGIRELARIARYALDFGPLVKDSPPSNKQASD